MSIVWVENKIKKYMSKQLQLGNCLLFAIVLRQLKSKGTKKTPVNELVK